MREDASRFDEAKRLADIALSVVLLIVSAPVQAVVAATVLAAHGRPILFRQARPGRGGVVFELVKFRTMVNPDQTRRTDADRLTRIGRLLRASSLDELPTLWNVLKGDMSLVGPRPLLVSYLARYTPEQARRHEVRPGVTGLAQVRGRNALSWEEKLRADVEYVDNRSLGLDLAILRSTIAAVLTRRGITDDGGATCAEFTGLPSETESGTHAA